MTDQHLLAHLSHNSGLSVSKSHASATQRKLLHALNLHLHVYIYVCLNSYSYVTKFVLLDVVLLLFCHNFVPSLPLILFVPLKWQGSIIYIKLVFTKNRLFVSRCMIFRFSKKKKVHDIPPKIRHTVKLSAARYKCGTDIASPFPDSLQC